MKNLIFGKIIRAAQVFFLVLYAHFQVVVFVAKSVFLGFRVALPYTEHLNSRSILWILKIYGARIGRNCDIQAGISFHNCRNFRNLRIGDNCHIGRNCFFDLRDSITIEDNTVISMYSRFITHIDMNRSSLSRDFPAASAPILIGNNCYFGVGSTVLMGVKVAPKVLVAANSLVNNSIEKSCKVAGIPARVIVD